MAPIPHDSDALRDYFTNIHDFEKYMTHASEKIMHRPLRRALPARRQLLVCHDYKGGYTEDTQECSYTFNWWPLCDTFVYFSHHRVSCPPEGWIHAAHASGTNILGTFIIEGHAHDLERLVDGHTGVTLTKHLADIADFRGFDGWLINIEIPFHHDKEIKAISLMSWVSALREECQRRNVHAQVIWYDAITRTGDLRWQNCVNDQNAIFFDAASSIFLNYFWSPAHVTITEQNALAQSRPSDVFFGTDMWNRGTYGGGGYDFWRAQDVLENTKSAFSTALFAPAWTVESSDLGHSLETRESTARWAQDDLTLWIGGHSVKSDRVVQERRRLALEVYERTRAIAEHYKKKYPALDEVLDECESTMDSFPPVSKYFSAHALPITDGRLVTYFSTGTGHDFFWRGEKVANYGPWTDLALATPPVTWLQQENVSLSFDTDDAWIGERSIVLSTSERESAIVDLFAIDRVDDCVVSVTWKAVDPEAPAINGTTPSTHTVGSGWSVSEVKLSNVDTIQLTFSGTLRIGLVVVQVASQGNSDPDTHADWQRADGIAWHIKSIIDDGTLFFAAQPRVSGLIAASNKWKNYVQSLDPDIGILINVEAVSAQGVSHDSVVAIEQD